MISTTVQSALNDQIQRELYSANLYLSMSAYFQGAGLPGFAHWMRIQYQEETAHALKFYDFVLSRGGEVRVPAIDAPPYNWDNVLDVFKHTLEHEQDVTAWINKLMKIAKDDLDFASDIFLQWFVSEQVEEEENVLDLLAKLKLINGEGQGLLMLDNVAATRVFTPPPPN